MRVLAIETSGDLCSVAVVEGTAPVAELRFRHRMDLARRLAPAIRRLLELAELGLPDLEGVAVSLGPGSFTGLRIGVTTAKTLAWSLGLPVAGISTLEALAAHTPLPSGALACPIVSIGPEEVAASLYARRGGPLEIIHPPEVLTLTRLGELCSERGETIVFSGSFIAPVRMLAEALGSRAVVHAALSGLPPAAVIGELGAARLGARGGDDRETLAPLYFRPSAAEARAGRA